MAKLNRERNVRERRVLKQAKKEARKNAVLDAADQTSDTLSVEDPTTERDAASVEDPTTERDTASVEDPTTERDTASVEDPTTEPPDGAPAPGSSDGQLAQAQGTRLT